MTRHDPLSPEERELARLLGRGGERAPSAALDDAILAAARQAVGSPESIADSTAPRTSPVPATRGRQRLSAVMGVAASVVFAVGIAWQLRPDPPPPSMTRADALLGDPAVAPSPDAETTAGTQETDAAAADAADAASTMESAVQDATPPAASAPMPLARNVPATPAPTAAAPAPASGRQAVPPSASAPSAHANRPASSQAAPAARAPQSVAPYAAIAPPAQAPQPAPPAQAARMMSAPAPAAAQEPAATESGAAAYAPQEALQRVVVTGQRAASAAKVAAPSLDAAAARAEIDADASLSRRQWLKKIRDRRDAGSVDLARASLERYLRTYPETRVPSDLRPLLDD